MKEHKVIDRNYGSIPHLSISKLTQQADKKISPGQETILTKKARDWKDLIIVTEKLDGSNVGIIRQDKELIPITRRGYTAISSRFEQHRIFHEWVMEHKPNFEWLPEGHRLCGEWMLQVHGTKYDMTDFPLFCAFDLIRPNNKRVLYLDFLGVCNLHRIGSVPLIHIGQPISIKNALKELGGGYFGKPEKPEGLVYRCEREGEVDFLAKYVRADKEDGKYMKEEIWNKGYDC